MSPLKPTQMLSPEEIDALLSAVKSGEVDRRARLAPGRRPRGMSDQAGRLRTRVSPRRARVITVTSGKGGVGKTTLVANLGLELARLGRRVLLLDGDLGLANLAILFDQTPRRTLEDALAGRCLLEDVVLQVCDGLAVLPAGAGVARLAELPDHDRRPLLGEIARMGTEHDLLIIDTGAGIGTTVQDLVALADRVLVVTTHEPTALSDAYGLLKAVRRPAGGPRIEIVVNLAQTHAQARETHGRLIRLTERFMGFTPGLAAVIPRDDAVGQAIARQKPLTRIYPYAPATRAIAALARLVVDTQGTDHAPTPNAPLAVSIRR